MTLLPPIRRMKWWLAVLQVTIAYTLVCVGELRSDRWKDTIDWMSAVNMPARLLVGNAASTVAVWLFEHFGRMPAILDYIPANLFGSFLLWLLVGYIVELHITRRPQSFRTKVGRDLLLIFTGLLIGPLYGLPGLHVASYGKLHTLPVATFVWFLVFTVYGAIHLAVSIKRREESGDRRGVGGVGGQTGRNPSPPAD